MIRCNALALAFLLSVFTAHASADEIATLSLDGLSFVSFDGSRNFSIPAGSIKLHFGEPNNGAVPFTISTGDTAIEPIPAGEDGGVIHYRLVSNTSGLMRQTSEGLRLEFHASIEARMEAPGGGGSHVYELVFTTETAGASDVTQTEAVEVDGMRVVPGPNYVQLVGAATNRPDAFPAPGAAVYAVLSGSFDKLPDIP